MIETKLFTRDGGFVATVDVPPMSPPPEVIIWGARLFVRQPSGEYREGLAWYAALEKATQPQEQEKGTP